MLYDRDTCKWFGKKIVDGKEYTTMKYRNDEAARAALKNLLENVIGLAEDLM